MQIRKPKEHRFDPEANRMYQVPISFFNSVRDQPMALFQLAYKFIRHHVDREVPRLQELMDYYKSETDIKSWPGSDNPKNAHNQVSTAFARYITNIRVGYFVGNDIQYKVTADQDDMKTTADLLGQLVDQYNADADTAYCDEMLKKDLSIMGRAYDLVYVNQGENTLNLAKIDPTTVFVVYDDSIKRQPLFAVRYYQTGVLDENLQERYEIYTDNMLYAYHSDGGIPETNSPVQNVILDQKIPTFFGRVPITEYINNDERMGDWEPEIDQMDALDKAISTMANFQEDFNNAALVATGKFANKTKPVYKTDSEGNKVIGKDGNPIVVEPSHPILDPKMHMFYLEPYIAKTGIGQGQRTVITPSLQYITKQYDANGWSTYINFLINEVHKYTNTPNVNDPNFASNASGVAMSYKLWGSDQERKIQESLFKKGLHNRLSCCVFYWDKSNAIPGDKNNLNVIEKMIHPNLIPNLPKNDEATAQLIQVLAGVPDLFSQETLRELAESITGVPADAEQQRVDDQAQHALDQDDEYKQGGSGIGRIFATNEEAIPGKANDQQPQGDQQWQIKNGLTV